MNLEDSKEKAVAEHAEKHGCSLAAARLALQSKPAAKPSTANEPQLEGGSTELPVETLDELKKPETGKK